MSASLTAHHAAARKIVMSVDTQLESLESGRDTSLTLQSEISQHLNALAREVLALENELPRASAPERSLWKKRIVQLQEQSKSQVRTQSTRSPTLQSAHHAEKCRSVLTGVLSLVCGSARR